MIERVKFEYSMNKYILLLTLICGMFLSCYGRSNSRFVAAKLHCEYRTDPAGVDTHKPRFGW